MPLNIPELAQLAAQLRAEIGDDDATILDTLDGEFDVFDLADALIGEMLGSRDLANAARERADEMRRRADRLDARADKRRALLVALLRAIGVTKLERPMATISLRTGQVSVLIEDEAAVPTQLCTVREVRTPDKKAIRAALEAGESVPGARLSVGPETVTVRTN